MLCPSGGAEQAPRDSVPSLSRHIPPRADAVCIRLALKWAVDLLSLQEERPLAQLEAEVLLCHQLRTDRTRLYSHLDEQIGLEKLRAYGSLVERRASREPVAYIVGHREFFGLDFLVDRRVLIPRPETELLVETVLERLVPLAFSRDSWLIADIGTGCGAVAVSLAVNLPQATIFATDISADALEVAAANGERHGVIERITIRQGDLLEVLPCAVDVIVANLPYVEHSVLAYLDPDVRGFEPVLALDGGSDGLDQYRRLLGSAPSFLRPGGFLVAEFGAGQGELMAELARRCFPRAHVKLLPDLAGIDRVLRVAT